MKEFFNKQTILLIVIAMILIWNALNNKEVKTDFNEYKNKMNSIQVKIDSAQAVNKEIDIKISEMGEKVINVTKEIHHIDNTITIVKNNTNEKINIADNFGTNELELFFANRYK